MASVDVWPSGHEVVIPETNATGGFWVVLQNKGRL
jgi:hypothetical protein